MTAGNLISKSAECVFSHLRIIKEFDAWVSFFFIFFGFFQK